jgi:hypothetical protein
MVPDKHRDIVGTGEADGRVGRPSLSHSFRTSHRATPRTKAAPSSPRPTPERPVKHRRHQPPEGVLRMGVVTCRAPGRRARAWSPG